MAIKFCIFDVGQVCYPYTLEPLNEFLREKSSDTEAFDKKNGIKSFDCKPFMKGEMSFARFCEDLCAYADVDYSAETEKKINLAMHDGAGAFFAETLEVMEELRKMGIEICLLSNALPNLAGTAWQLAAPDKTFVSYELKLLKPDTEIYKTVLMKLDAKPEEVIFVDDKPKNIEAAQSLGIRGIVFQKETLANEVARILRGRVD